TPHVSTLSLHDALPIYGCDALRVMTSFDQMPYLGGDHARLAAARPRQHEERPVEVAHCFALRRIQRKGHRRIGIETARADAKIHDDSNIRIVPTRHRHEPVCDWRHPGLPRRVVSTARADRLLAARGSAVDR